MTEKFCNGRDPYCEKPATIYYELLSRIAFRCDEHKGNIVSKIMSQGKVFSDGTLEENETRIEARIHQRFVLAGVKDEDSYNDWVDKYAQQIRNFTPKEFKKFIKEHTKKNPIQAEAFEKAYYQINKYVKRQRGEKEPPASLIQAVKTCKACQQFVRDEDKEGLVAHMGTSHHDVIKDVVNENKEQFILDKKVLPTEIQKLPHDKQTDWMIKELRKQNLTQDQLLARAHHLKIPLPVTALALKEIFGVSVDERYIGFKFDVADMMESCNECMMIIAQKGSSGYDADRILLDHFNQYHSEDLLVIDAKYDKNLESILTNGEDYKDEKRLYEEFLVGIAFLKEKEKNLAIERYIKRRESEIKKNYPKEKIRYPVPSVTAKEMAEIIVPSLASEQKDVLTEKPQEVKKERFRQFQQAREYARAQNLHSRTDWQNHTKTSDFPDDIPVYPEKTYRDEFIDYADFCGFEKQVRRPPLTKETIQRILKLLNDRWNFYMLYTDGMFTDWFTTQGLFSIKDPVMKRLFTEFIGWRHKPEGREALRYWLETGDYTKEFGHYSLVQKKQESVPEYLDRQFTKLEDYETRGLAEEPEPIGVEKIMLEAREVIPTIHDKRWFDTQIEFTVKLLWQELFDEDREESEWQKILNEKLNHNAFHDEIVKRIRQQYQEVKTLNYDKEYYTYGKPPTLSQLYTTWKMRKINGFINMCSTGTGKTGAGIISSRATRSQQTLVICPKNIVEQWVRNIKKFYNHSFVASGKDLHKNFFVSAGKHTTKFHVVNYDKFGRKKTAENLISQIKQGNIDFIIIDEAQFIKKREIDEFYESNRRKNISVLISHLRKQNRKLKVLMLSATPVINNIREGVSLLNMLTGTTYNIPTHNTIRNASRLYTEFQPFSISYIKNNHIKEFGRAEPIKIDAFIPENYSNEEIMNINWNQLEQIATRYRIPKILEILKNTTGKTVIYTDYVTGIISQLQEAVTNAGYRVGLFIGDDKSGLIEKRGVDNEGNDLVVNRFVQGDLDVLIASRPFAVGIDEVQYVCNNLIFNGLVWTWAQFEQIIGRVVRTGQAKSFVNIYLILAKINGYDYDEKVKYNRLIQKKAIGDCVRYGTLPEKISFGYSNEERKKTLLEMIKNKESGFPSKEELTLSIGQDAVKELEDKISMRERQNK